MLCVSMNQHFADPCRSHLCIMTALEERCDADQTDIVVPHDSVYLVVVRQFESVLEDF
jgi:hypothetical protein